MNKVPPGLVFVDCEAVGLGCPSLGLLTEIGAVHYESRQEWHGVLIPHKTVEHLVGVRVSNDLRQAQERLIGPVFTEFLKWLHGLEPEGKRLTMVSDNPAFDWQWVNDGFLRTLGANPFGFSARRIGDFYAGLVGDFRRATDWKAFRRTPHDHHPVHDARGNVEAFEQMLEVHT
jgi:hypothetical protein